MLIEYYCVGADVLAFVRRGAEVELRTVAAVEDVEALVDKLSFQIGKCSLGAEYVHGEPGDPPEAGSTAAWGRSTAR